MIAGALILAFAPLLLVPSQTQGQIQAQTAAAAPAADPAQPSLQDRTQPPSTAPIVAVAQGRGVQIYRCTARDGHYDWTLQAPEATLFPLPGPQTSSNQPLGTHSAGPTWTWADGSSITGHVVASAPSPQATNIPTLLLETYPAGTTRGLLSSALWVRRSNAEGGVAPADGCDAPHADAVQRVPYTATYTFYGAAPSVTAP